MVILILGFLDDEHALHVFERLRALQCDVEIFDSRWFPSQASLSFDPHSGEGMLRLPSGRALAWSEIESVYWRNYGGAGACGLPDEEQAFIADNDARSLLETFLTLLPARWVNGWDAFRLHQTKPVCLARAAALGAEVPRTLLTSDPDSARLFAQRHSRLIFKPVQGGDQTRVVTPRHLTDENLEHLRLAPVTLQEEIAGTNIRVFVAGQRVMACEIETGELDYREDFDARLTVHALPAEMESLVLRIARESALVWTGMDFRLTPEGRYVFLEANPSPMFLGFESRTELPLTELLIGLLVGSQR